MKDNGGINIGNKNFIEKELMLMKKKVDRREVKGGEK